MSQEMEMTLLDKAQSDNGRTTISAAIDTLRSSMSGAGHHGVKSSGGVLRPSLKGSKVMKWAIREGEPSSPLHNEVTDST